MKNKYNKLFFTNLKYKSIILKKFLKLLIDDYKIYLFINYHYNYKLLSF